MMKCVACPHGCGAVLSRHQLRYHHTRCPAMAPLRLQPRKCNNPGRDCETAFVPGERNPNQKYCSEACGREADHWRRANAPDRNPAAPPVDRDAEQMAAIRAREARQREEAERLGVALAANAERRYVLWLELLGVRG